MRKTLLGLVAAAAIATPLALASSASAHITYDSNAVGSISKGEVQSGLGLSAPRFQQHAKAGDITFTTQYQMDNKTRWTCGNTEQSQTSRVIQERALNVTLRQDFTKENEPVVAFNLNGVDETQAGTYVSGERFGALYVGWCPAGKAFKGFLPNVFTNTVVPNTVKAHGPNMDGILTHVALLNA